MSSIHVITVAFCPAAQLARSIIEFRRGGSFVGRAETVALGYYPINCNKNNRDIKMICEAFDIQVLDPGKNLGSAQTQNWMLSKIPIQDDEYFINLDPDSNCYDHRWIPDARSVLFGDPDCVVISCNSPLVTKFVKSRKVSYRRKQKHCVKYRIYDQPVPFNLSLWRYSFIKEIGGIPQMGEMWGETEGPLHAMAAQRGKYHAYLEDYMEDESGKLMQDRQLLEFKDKNLRTLGPEQFPGIYKEYLAWKYPEALKLDTLIAENTDFQ